MKPRNFDPRMSCIKALNFPLSVQRPTCKNKLALIRKGIGHREKNACTPHVI